MPGPEQKKTPRQSQARINGSGNMAGIAIARVGNQASNRWAGSFFRRASQDSDLTREFRRIIRVKTAGNCGQAKHRMCHHSILKAISEASEILYLCRFVERNLKRLQEAQVLGRDLEFRLLLPFVERILVHLNV
jgi:hypothetical protein